MPYDPNIVVEVGQVWTRKEGFLGKITEYRVKQIHTYGSYKEVYSDRYVDGGLSDTLIFMGYLCRNGTPDCWSEQWTCMNPKTFTKVNPKTLRKRMRDQLAALVLTHRLTEAKEKL